MFFILRTYETILLILHFHRFVSFTVNQVNILTLRGLFSNDKMNVVDVYPKQVEILVLILLFVEEKNYWWARQ